MPRFPAAFSRRKSSVDHNETPVTGSSFRVLDRSELSGPVKNFDAEYHGIRKPAKSRTVPSVLVPGGGMPAADSVEDNIFADLHHNRGSGSSNTTKATSNDNSSRHSNASTAPSSADYNNQYHQDDWGQSSRRMHHDLPVPPIPKSSTTGNFLKSAGRTFSFGGNKKPHTSSPVVDDRAPATPPETFKRDRAATASTVSTATPPKLKEDFNLDLGGDFSKMVDGFDKRSSVMTLRNSGPDRPALAPRSLTGNRLSQPAPLDVNNGSKVDPSPYAWGGHNSSDELSQSTALMDAPPTNENAPPVPKHIAHYGKPSDAEANKPIPTSEPAPEPPASEIELKRSSAVLHRRQSTLEYANETEDEDAVLLKDSYNAMSKFLAGEDSPTGGIGSTASRFKQGYLDSGYKQIPTEAPSPMEPKVPLGENMFDVPVSRTRKTTADSSPPQPGQGKNKVMTPAQFERYRKDKELETRRSAIMAKPDESADADEDNYDEDDDLDEAEKSRQVARQRRKQEAHMTVYRQQMMKVTGESPSGPSVPSNRISLQFSLSSPNLPSIVGAQGGGSDVSDDDEEVPLAILAAHGFPNKNRPPARLSTMMSNPNLRAANALSYQRPASVIGDVPAASNRNSQLPPFARNIPQDPYGLVSPPVRESLQFSGGIPAGSMQANSTVPPGGLVGVIASEERSRAMRRGSPSLNAINKPLPAGIGGQFDPTAVIPAQSMYPGVGLLGQLGQPGQLGQLGQLGQPQQPALSVGEQAQIQMTQQMQQFMQMQMQFMQMMTNNGNAVAANGMQQRPQSHYSNASGMGPSAGGAGFGLGGLGGLGVPDTGRQSFMDNASVLDFPGQRPDGHLRTMSMVQPSSASWIQPLGSGGSIAPSIRVQGVNGYAPSIAPSERSNVGLPGRYRPVSHMPAASQPSDLRKSMVMSGALGTGDSTSNENSRANSPSNWDQARKTNKSPLNNSSTANEDEDDDEQGWAAMKAKREKKRMTWKSKKMIGSEIGALIS